MMPIRLRRNILSVAILLIAAIGIFLSLRFFGLIKADEISNLQFRVKIENVSVKETSPSLTNYSVTINDMSDKPSSDITDNLYLTDTRLSKLPIGSFSAWVPAAPIAGFKFSNYFVIKAFTPIPNTNPVQYYTIKGMKVTIELKESNGNTVSATETADTKNVLIWKYNNNNHPLLTPLSSEYASSQTLSRSNSVKVADTNKPSLFVVADNINPLGAQSTQMKEMLQTIRNLGSNTVTAWGGNSGLKDTFTKLANDVGINKFGAALGGGYPGQYVYGGAYGTDEDMRRYAANTVKKGIEDNGVDSQKITVFPTSDEPSWQGPNSFNDINANSAALARYRTYLQSHSLTPDYFGKNNWNEVVGIDNQLAVDPSQNNLNNRKLFYWQERYLQDYNIGNLSRWANAIHSNISSRAHVSETENNYADRTYIPHYSKPYNGTSLPGLSFSKPDWFTIGRMKNLRVWTEDWMSDFNAEYVSFQSSLLHSAAMAGGTSDFGQFLVGIRTGTLANNAGATYKALSLLGHGSKIVYWYMFGPYELQKGEGYSLIDTAASLNTHVFQSIANANTAIGKAERLLYPGQVVGRTDSTHPDRRNRSEVAILKTLTSSFWDVNNNRDSSGKLVNEDTEQIPIYDYEMQGIQYILSHNQYPVDFLDETAIEQGVLSGQGYRVLYVTTPNITIATQNQIKSWVAAGNTAIFFPGAGTADELNNPTTILNDVTGVTSIPITRKNIDKDNSVSHTVSKKTTTLNIPTAATVKRDIYPLQIATGNEKIACFDSPNTCDQVAMTSKTYGTGKTYSLGFWPSSTYLNTILGDRPDSNTSTTLASGWDQNLDQLITALLNPVGITKPVEVSSHLVEADRLDSKNGIAVVLLNWSNTPITNTVVKLHDAPGTITSIKSATTGNSITYTRTGNDIQFSLNLTTTDVILIDMSNTGRYGSPAIEKITPYNGPTTGAVPVTVHGSNFDNNTIVKIGGSTCPITSVEFYEITCTLPLKSSTGSVDVVVINGALSATLSKGFTYHSPLPEVDTVRSVTPYPYVSTAGGMAITINGRNFNAGATVKLDSSNCTNVVVSDNGTQIVCSTPQHTKGFVDLSITNPDGAQATVSKIVNYIELTLNNVSPTTLSVSGGNTLSISGVYFAPGMTISIDNTTCSNVVVTTFAAATCQPPSHAAGTVVQTVKVRNTDGTSATKDFSFTYGSGPTITTVNPSSGSINGGTTITINGTNFQANATVKVGNLPCATPAVNAGVVITCTTPAHAAGAVSVTITNPDNSTITKNNAFTYSTAATKTACLTISLVNRPTTDNAYGPISVNVYNTQGQTVATKNDASSDASGTVSITDPAFTQSLVDGTPYSVVIKPNGYLSRKIANLTTILSGCAGVGNSKKFLDGDYNSDNKIDARFDLPKAIFVMNGNKNSLFDIMYKTTNGIPTVSDLSRIIFNYNNNPLGE